MPTDPKTGKKVFVAVRSSATTEDTKDASFAGQHDTFLFQKTIEDIESTVRSCWASVFTDRAVEYRGRNKIAHKEAVMSVVVQEMVDPVVAGTAFSVEVSTGYPAIHIAATYGLGEAVVSGMVTSDEWLIEPSDHAILKRVRGSKKQKCISIPGKSGFNWVDVDSTDRDRLCMPDGTAQEIAQNIATISKVYKQLFGYEHVDTEFGINQENQVRMLQSRPVVEMDASSV